MNWKDIAGGCLEYFKVQPCHQPKWIEGTHKNLLQNNWFLA
jgi:hypothetical protein